jgi:hypothetical protein
MTITNGYVTLAEAKGRLWPTGAPADTSEDTQIEAIIEAASRQIDADCWRRFYTTAADETRYYKPISFDCILPDDIVSITSIAIDQDGNGTFEVTLAATDYELLPYNAVVDGIPYNHIITSPMGNYSFPRGYKSVKIVGKFGWSNTTAAPKQIKEACFLRCLIEYQTKNLFGGTGKINETLEEMEKQYQRLISNYVRLV